MLQIIKKIPEAINNFFKKHWFWYTIIIAFPTAWFSVIVPFAGKQLRLQSKNGLTNAGVIISIVLVLIVAFLVFVNNWYSSKSEKGALEQLQGEVEYLKTITENVDNICKEKYDQLIKTIVSIKKSGNCEIPKIVTRPSNQLKRIIEGMTSCLVKFIETPGNEYAFKDFLVSITYNFPTEDNTWEWVDGMMERDLSLDELLASDCASTFKYLMNSSQPYYFNNRKEDAKRDHRYHYNKQDELNEENDEPVGSIFCYNFKIKKGKTIYIDAYLSISTTKKRFAVDDDEICKNTRDNMLSLVKDSFGKRIGIELCLLYLEYIGKKRDDEEAALLTELNTVELKYNLKSKFKN